MRCHEFVSKLNCIDNNNNSIQWTDEQKELTTLEGWKIHTFLNRLELLKLNHYKLLNNTLILFYQYAFPQHSNSDKNTFECFRCMLHPIMLVVLYNNENR